MKYIAKPKVVDAFDVSAVSPILSDGTVSVLLKNGQELEVSLLKESEDLVLVREQHGGRVTLMDRAHFEQNFKDAVHSGHSTGE